MQKVQIAVNHWDRFTRGNFLSKVLLSTTVFAKEWDSSRAKELFYPKMCAQKWQSPETKMHKTQMIILQALLERHTHYYSQESTHKCGLIIKIMDVCDSLPDHFTHILSKERKESSHLSNLSWSNTAARVKLTLNFFPSFVLMYSEGGKSRFVKLGTFFRNLSFQWKSPLP